MKASTEIVTMASDRFTEEVGMHLAVKAVITSLILVLCLSGCNPVQRIKTRQTTEKLDSIVDTYRKLIRWGYYEQATEYLKAKDDEVIEADLVSAAAYKVTHYSINNKVLSDDQLGALVIASIEYYEVETGKAKKLRDEQLWWFDAETERWYLSSGLPNFKAGK